MTRRMTMGRQELRDLLGRLEPLDEVERGHRDAIALLLALPGDVTSRDHYEPGHVTASGFVLSPDDEKLLLIHHGKLHRWLQPGGHCDDDDESVEAAARREVSEETGASDLELLQAPFDVDVHEIPARASSPAHRHYDVRFLFRAKSERIACGSDALQARWVPLSRVASLESDDSVLRAVRKLRNVLISFR